ncbi:MAG: winged helix DNA-binding domain-containing protein [Lachnospiraceae bacterium]|nr:winged helix DNA-binding domain-containing protein [Lachnospiraceae bacterium]MDE7239227.1 winged helix DNA-binding domain-containing protein [Lachnospiraceae bacterium]
MKLYTKQEARQLLCRYHNLDGVEALCGKAGAEKIMQRIHSIQYDPLNVVARNADLVLQARVKDYKEQDLYDLLYKEQKLVDGFDKEMCIYESKDFDRFRQVRSEHLKQIVLTLQYRNQMGVLDILDEVRAFVAKHGKTGTKDISIGEVRESSWGPKKLSSAALDYLFNSGEFCVAEKRGTQKYFDLTERVLADIDFPYDQDMTIEEFLEWYVERRLQSVGLIWNKSGGAWQGHFVGDNELRSSTLQTLAEKNKIEEMRVEGIDEAFYAPKGMEANMDYQTSGSYARFIAPLDNMMWDRQMVEALFDFAYRWEVYTPVIKRKYGYYVLPVLYNGELIARFEAEPVRKAGEFVIKNWWWEAGVAPDNDMIETIEQEMLRFAEFLRTEYAKDNMEKLRV